jgi:MFS family permease
VTAAAAPATRQYALASSSRVERITYADIFAVREFRALFASRTMSTIGDYLARAVLVIAVFNETGSTALLGITFALTSLPELIGGPVLAGLADRFPRRAVMVPADVVRAILLLVMAIPGLPLVNHVSYTVRYGARVGWSSPGC